MKVDEITPNVDSAALLAGAQFIDAFRIAIAGPDIDARHATEAMMAGQPRWAKLLIALRNLLLAPLGLKTSGATEGVARDMIGICPVVSETPERLIAGFNDKHLDFRLVVDVAPDGLVRNVTATTLVLTHNWFGRAYLAVIMPFHRLIVPAMLRKVGE
jgi:hypothetical protein